MSMEADKEFVLARIPDANCFGPPVYVRPGFIRKHPDYFIVSVAESKNIAEGDTESEAWANAAALLKQNEQSGQPGDK